VSKPDFRRAYGVEHPVVLAGMAMVAVAELVAAVSAAGGLGVLGTGGPPPALLREWIAAVRARTARPFGVNLIVEDTPGGPLAADAHLDVAVAERVSPVVFHWNPPPKGWAPRLRAAGLRVWRTVNSAEDAVAALAGGADALVAQGAEAGGHNRGTVPLAELLPAVVRVAGDAHVIAAGGIADADSARGAFARGADAVCLGTRFVACAESPAHEEWQRRILAAGPGDTAVTRIFGPEWPDAPMRVLRNRAVARAERGEPAPAGVGAVGTTLLFGQRYELPRCSVVLPTRDTRGDLDELCLAAGTSAAAIHRIETAAEIVRSVARAAG
jgi:NAD(P)H-dependent flavin oxidoreductase YrpB (nitropropane dioxygenase family)